MESFFKLFLYPFALFYGVIIWMRNKLYDHHYLHAQSFDIPIINVGNLSVGGTGKTPHVEYLINLLQTQYKIATLSRGYKRQTKGYRVADVHTSAKDIGDEPYLFYLKYPNINVTVAEERMFAIPEIIREFPGTDLIIMDDAFQHRSVRAGFNILLTDYSKLFIDDYLLPFGSLRDVKSSYKRADIIIVTKCPEQFDRVQLTKRINVQTNQRLFFSKIKYNSPYLLADYHQKLNWDQSTKVILVSAIANNKTLVDYIATKTNEIIVKSYTDHYYFEQTDLEDWKNLLVKNPKHIIITTEKDATKLVSHIQFIRQHNIPVYIMPIEIGFDVEEKELFDHYIQEYILWERKRLGWHDDELESAFI